MKKLFITFFIAVSLSGLLFPLSKVLAYKPPNADPNNTKVTYDKQADYAFQKYLREHNNQEPPDQNTWVGYNNNSANQMPAEPPIWFMPGGWAGKVAENPIIQLADFSGSAKEMNGQDGVKPSACSGTGALSFDCVWEIIFSIITLIGNIILSLAAWILWCGGVILNYSISYLVLEMKTRIGDISAIYYVWRAVRDLANMFFIFILLAIAIQTILQIGNYKTMIRNVILVALFINFSFFLTSVLIDASNIIATQFYKGIGSPAVVSARSANDGGMTLKVTQALGLSSVYGMSPNNGTNMTGNSNLSATGPGNVGRFIVTVLFGSILMIITASIFLASAIMIAARFVQLILLLMFSPLAFAALALPGAKKYWSKWWNKLVAQLIFAPVYFMFLWVTMAVITSDMFTSAIGKKGLVEAVEGNQASLTGLILNFIIVILMLGYSLVLAKELGAAGVDVATKASKGVQGFVGRNTAGRLASRFANSETVKNFRQNSPTLGRYLQSPLNKAANYGFGSKIGYSGVQKRNEKSNQEFIKTLGPSPVDVRNAENESVEALNESADAKENLEQARETTKKEVNEDYVEREAEIDTQIKTYETALTDQKAEVERLLEIEASPNKTEVEQNVARAARIKTEQSAADKQEAIEDLKKQKISEKETKIAAALKPHEERAEAAKERADTAENELIRLTGKKLNGKKLEEGEAELRATSAVMKDAKENNWEGDKAKIDKAIKEMTKEITESAKGVAKINQEKFAANIEAGFGGVVAKLVPTQMKGATQTVINAVFDTALGGKKTRFASAQSLRKGKSPEAQFLETVKKQIKEDTEAESGGKGKTDDTKKGGEKKSEGEEKPES